MGWGKPEPRQRSLRKKSGRRAGKQPGAGGSALSQVDDPDRIVEYRPASCVGCGSGLDEDALVAGRVVRQEFDVPPLRLEVTEHQIVSCVCACGVVSGGAAPAHVKAATQYGLQVVALVAYLRVYQHLPVARCAQLLADVLNAPVSTGFVASVVPRVAAGLEVFAQRAVAAVAAAEVAGFDETGARVAGKNRWVHVARTEQLTCYGLFDQRGVGGMDALGVLPRFTGIAVHDGWASYATYDHIGHALCNAHHRRELQAAFESDPDAQIWARAAADALVGLWDQVKDAHAAGTDHVPPEHADRLCADWRNALLVGRAANPVPPGQRGRGKIRALVDRLIIRTSDALRFVSDFRVPFDNNGSERDIRMVKTQLKISGCMRTIDGARDWLRVRSYISTIRKNSIDILQAIHAALSGNPWLPTLSTQS